jgi:UDP-glucose 4-epimerase
VTVLVTGASGFLGSYVMAALGDRAHGFDVAPPGWEACVVAPGLAANLSIGQVTDAARLAKMFSTGGINAVVHTAGLVGLEASLRHPASFYETNVMGFVQICEAARLACVKRLVLVSSNAAYHAPSGPRLVETDPVFSIERGNPAGHYGTTKMMQEAIGLAYASFHGLDVIVLRVTAIYGFGMRSPMYIKPMVEDAVAGRPTRLAEGGPMKRDYTYVLDCAEAVLAALAAPAERSGPRVLNISAGQAVTAGEVAQIVRDVLPGADIEIGDTLSPLEAENNRMRASLDISAAQSVLGWTPAWPLPRGIADYAQRLRLASAESAHA